MRDKIEKILHEFSESQINLSSEVARRKIADTIIVSCLSKGKTLLLEENQALKKEISELIKAITLVAKKLGISINGGEGYRALANIGSNGGQEVPHLHFHLFGGEKIGKMVS